MSEALCDRELILEMADVLPDREVLSAINVNVVTQVAVPIAVTALSRNSFTTAFAFNFAVP